MSERVFIDQHNVEILESGQKLDLSSNRLSLQNETAKMSLLGGAETEPSFYCCSNSSGVLSCDQTHSL